MLDFKNQVNLIGTCCISDSMECGNNLTLDKYHLHASSASISVIAVEPTAEGWKGTTKSAGKMFDLPSDKISNWTSVVISIL